jgi:excisionase family DNA binding protein
MPLFRDQATSISTQKTTMKNKAKSKSQPLNTNGEILNKKETAALLGVTTKYLERQVRAGKLRASKPSFKLIRFQRKDIFAWLDKHASIEA